MNLNDARSAAEELDRAIRSGEPDSIARSAADNVWPLYNNHPELLSTTIVGLPRRVLEQHPMLCVLHPMAPALAQALHPFSFADDANATGSRSPEEVDFADLAANIAFRLSGDVESALESSRKLEQHLLDTRVESHARVDGPIWFFHHQIGTTMLAAGDSSGAILEFETARQLGKISSQADAERMSLGGAALAHAVRGAHDDAQRALRQARQLPAPTLPHRGFISSSETLSVALLAVDRSAEDIDVALAAMDTSGSEAMSWPFALLARCRTFLMREQAEDALEATHLAAGAHYTQPSSFAADVVAAMSIQALLATGDLVGARSVADEVGNGGMLTQLAIARLLLLDGRFDAAAQKLRLIAADRQLGPAQRAESILLDGWYELGLTGEITPQSALRISRTARRQDSRRQFSNMPRQLLQRVTEILPPDIVAGFEKATAGLATVEFVTRPVLTTSELRILNALPELPSTASMANAFHLSPNTVKSQLRALYRKLGCSTRADAILIATRLRLLSGEPSS